MQVLICVLNKIDCLEDILKEFVQAGIKGATIIDSMGMAKVLNNNTAEVPMFASLKMLLNERHPFNKTIFVVLPDEQISQAVTCIKKIVGDISEPGTGIIFTIPVNFVEGGMFK